MSENLALFEDIPWLPEEDVQPAGSLRYYQEQAIEAVEAAWDRTRSCLVVMATGLGKTQVFSSIAGMADGRVLVLAHRSELVDQAVRRLEHMTGEVIGVEQAELRSGRERIVVGSVQTVYRPRRLERLRRNGGFSVVIVDEAHHYVARTYRKAVEAWGDAKILGVTATPDRGDEKALGQIFDDVAFEMDIMEGIEAGYLVPLVGRREEVDVDISGVDTSAGDLVAAQLDEEIFKVTEGIVGVMLEKYADRKGVAFFPGKRSAVYAAERLNLRKPGCAVVITDDTDRYDRKEIIRAIHRGDVQYLCNCMIATEGFDWPEANVIFNARPTKSRALYAQIAGRGTRVLPDTVDSISGEQGAAARRAAIAASAKPDCILVDFCGNSGKHSLIGPEDILGGRYTEDEVRKAKEKAEKDGGGDPLQHLKEAREALQLLARKAKARVKSRSETFDPFAVFGGSWDDSIEDRYSQRAPATKKQVATLEKMGVKEAHRLSKAAASKLLDTAFVRRKHGLATYKQMRILQRYGITKTNVGFDTASAAISYLVSTGWGKRGFDPMELRRICDA